MLVHKTCVGIEHELDKNQPWFCDYCLHVKTEDLRKGKSLIQHRHRPPTNGHISPNSDSKGSEEVEQNGTPHSEASSEGRDESSRKKKLKKRKKMKFHNERKARRKKQMQMNAILVNRVIEETKQKERQPSAQSYNWQDVEGLSCLFCKLSYGAFMKLDKPANSWGHLSCGFWLPHTNPYMPHRMIYLNTKGLKELHGRKATPCAYCKGTEGIMVQCVSKDCPVVFHVECGRRSFCELKFPYQLKIKQKEHVVFCFQHSQTFNSRRIEQSLATEWGQIKNVLKGFKNHHVMPFHFDLKTQAKKIRPKKLVVHLKRVNEGREGSGFAFVKTTYD